MPKVTTLETQQSFLVETSPGFRSSLNDSFAIEKLSYVLAPELLEMDPEHKLRLAAW